MNRDMDEETKRYIDTEIKKLFDHISDEVNKLKNAIYNS